MSIGSILFGFSLLILVVLYLSRPFVVAPERERRRRRGRQAMLLEKNALLEQIRSLDFEHETGKLPTEIYAAQREALVQETAVILQKLDAAPVSNGNAANLDAKIEAAIAQIRGAQPAAAAAPAPVQKAGKPASAGKLASAGKPVSTGKPGGSAGFCPQCGNPVDQGDKFCSTCGHKLV